MRSHDPGQGGGLHDAAICIEFHEHTIMAALGEVGRNRPAARRILQYEARMLRDLGLVRESMVLAGVVARLAN
ncbi:hypothetical protein [Radicibacter daui]|uniref:hypothetical protein n=1 Tax=Radicibacter daui TaxID=3064829 RepID=UPI004046E8DE